MARDFDTIIADATGQDPRQSQSNGQDTQSETPPDPNTQLADALGGSSVGGALAPMLAMEKTDLMFWLLLIQTVLLAGIYVRLGR